LGDETEGEIMTPALNREDAQLLVDNVTLRVDQYAAVSTAEARSLLGEIDYERMMKNQVKNKGATVVTVYPWNIVDYLSGYRTPKEIHDASSVSKGKS